jgi:hypothetical protein
MNRGSIPEKLQENPPPPQKKVHTDSETMEGVLVKLNPGLSSQKLHLTRRRIFLPANWT